MKCSVNTRYKSSKRPGASGDASTIESAQAARQSPCRRRIRRCSWAKDVKKIKKIGEFFSGDCEEGVEDGVVAVSNNSEPDPNFSNPDRLTAEDEDTKEAK